MHTYIYLIISRKNKTLGTKQLLVPASLDAADAVPSHWILLLQHTAGRALHLRFTPAEL